MNDIQKKSIIISTLLLINYYLVSSYQSLFFYLFLGLMILVVGFSLYFFNIKWKKDQILEEGKFLILPILFNLGSVFYIASLFQPVTRFAFSLLVAIANYYLFIAIKKVQNLEERAAIFQRNILVSLSFVTLLLTLSAIFRWYVLLTNTAIYIYLPILLVVLVGLIFYFLSYFLAWENGINLKKFLPYNLVNTFLAAQITLISIIWIVNYPVFSTLEKSNLGGLPLPAIYLTITFYFIWGIISHKMDKSLSRKVMTEYVIITLLFLLVLITSARWLPII